jgi:RNA polymerase sigma-70 factor (ECF subfamily)
MIGPIESTDESLVRAAQAGDRAAMQELLSRHYDRLHAVCRRLAGNDADADDACQEALMAVVRGLPKFDGRSSFKTWSYRVATNACLDELRRRKRRPLELIDDDALESPIGDFDQQVADRVTLDRLWAQIPEEFRAPVALRDVLGMDYAEIADALDLPPGTVRSRIARGRGHLARLLGNQTPTDGRQS